MSTKFEQLLDYLVNEEMDKANELFHEIVVEKSRSIYENLIAEEEAEEDKEMDEAAEEADESVDEAEEDADESVEESEEDLEDSYAFQETEDGFDSTDDDATGELGQEIGAGDHDDEEGHEASEDSAILDIKNAIAELEAAFAELEQAQGGEEADMGMDSEFGDEEGEDDEMMGSQAFESRRITREYKEKVGNDWEKNSQKTQGQALGANTGESFPAPTEGKSPISSGSGKPTSGANANNIAKGGDEGTSNTGTSPAKVNKGINPESGEKFAKGIHNVDGTKSGVKTLSKVGGQDKGEGKAVGAGTGANSVSGSTNTTSPLKHIK
jgi:hypothetical protein